MKKFNSVTALISISVIALSILFGFISCETAPFKDPLTPQEREWLTQHDRKITIAIETSYAPFAFVDENGISRGLVTEYVDLIEKKLNFKFKKVIAGSLNEILIKAQQKKIDVVNAVTKTPKRSEYLLFTDPVIEIPNAIIVRKDQKTPLKLEKMKNMKVSLVKDYAITEFVEKNFPDVAVDPVADDLTALLKVSFNLTNAAIIDLATASYFVEQKGITNLHIAGDAGYPIKLAIASRADWPIANRIIEKGLFAISDKERSAIKKKWISFGPISLFESREFWIVTSAAIFVVLLIMAGIIAWNRVLKQRIANRTLQLQNELAERHRVEDSLRTSQQIIEGIIQSIPVRVFWKDENLFYLGSNKAFANDAGFADPKDIIGRDDYQMGWREQAELYRADDRQVIESGQPKLLIEEPQTTPEGNTLILLTSKMPLRNLTGEIIGVLGTYMDITERKRAEEERLKLEERLRQAQKMESIGTLAGGIAHDFNNILYPLLGFSELLKEDIPADSPLQNYIDEIFRATMRSKDLVKQILAFSRKSDQNAKPVRLEPLITEALKLLRSSIPTTIDIQQAMDPNCGIVIADPTQIHQIVMNLATNAYHAMEDTGGKLNVCLRQVELTSACGLTAFESLTPGKYALLTVSDTGTGIEKEILDKIFDPYFTTKEVGKGTGLGLSVVQGIVKTHKGEILVDSKPGKGTAVHVYLPIMAPTVENKQVAESEPIPGGTEKILLVDDDEVIVGLEQQILERLGYHVTSRTSSKEALGVFRESPEAFDLVLTDMTMPDMTGTQLAEKLMVIRPDIPVIICTGFSERIKENERAAMGIKGFLLKPVVKSELACLVRGVLDKAKDAPPFL